MVLDRAKPQPPNRKFRLGKTVVRISVCSKVEPRSAFIRRHESHEVLHR